MKRWFAGIVPLLFTVVSVLFLWKGSYLLGIGFQGWTPFISILLLLVGFFGSCYLLIRNRHIALSLINVFLVVGLFAAGFVLFMQLIASGV
ncbi:MAG TPA: hypothetical protein VF199_09140 [Bacillales bacterium]